MNAVIIDYQNPHLMKEIPDIQPKILVGGCFDILHYGHLIFFQRAYSLGNKIIIALESDDKIIELKKRAPFHNQDQRALILSSLNMVAGVIKLDKVKTDKDYEKLVTIVKPNYIAVTEGDINLHKKKRSADLVGAKVIEVSPVVEEFSTSKILKFT
jgi:cytidyltransferase-like protein